MIAQPVYVGQYANNEISAAKKLFTEMKTVNRVAEAVDSITGIEQKEKSDFGKLQVIILNEWDEEQNNISLPESYLINGNTVAQWNDEEKSYYHVCSETSEPVKLSHSQDISNEEDHEDSENNLSWLLDFKVESLVNPLLDEKLESKSPFGPSTQKQPRKVVETIKSTQPPIAEGIGIPRYTNVDYKKPPFTYTELIEQALEEKGELTVSGIYKWITLNFPYYRADDDRWKNSVRHNLSINPHFSKGGKARKGAGHLWTVVCGEERSRSSWKRRKLEQFVSDQRRRDIAAQLKETSEAARLIAGDMNARRHQEDLKGWVTTQVISLEQSAEDILKGVKREVEVEYLNSIPAEEERSCGSADSDFLNPVPKYEAVKESGLLSDEGLIPIHYGDLHLSHPSHDVSFFTDEEMTLQYYELALAAANQ